MRAAFWTCGCAAVGGAAVLGGAFLWMTHARAAEESAAVADLRKEAAQAGLGLPAALRVWERDDDTRDRLRVRAWKVSSDGPASVAGLRERDPSDAERDLDREMLQKQFPERRIQGVLQKRWTRGEKRYWVLSARDQGTWYTFFESVEPVP